MRPGLFWAAPIVAGLRVAVAFREVSPFARRVASDAARLVARVPGPGSRLVHESESCINSPRLGTPTLVKRNRMLRSLLASRRQYAVVALCSAFAVVLATAAGAETLRADLDGDGVHDRIETGRRPGLFAVRLSGTHRWLQFDTHEPIIRLIVADIDHDGDADVVAETRHSGLRFWINKGRGRFAFGSPGLRHRALRAHHTKPTVRGVRELRVAESALNDPNRLLGVLPAPLCDGLVAAGPIALAASAPLAEFTHRRHAARGPPRLLLS